MSLAMRELIKCEGELNWRVNQLEWLCMRGCRILLPRDLLKEPAAVAGNRPTGCHLDVGGLTQANEPLRAWSREWLHFRLENWREMSLCSCEELVPVLSGCHYVAVAPKRAFKVSSFYLNRGHLEKHAVSWVLPQTHWMWKEGPHMWILTSSPSSLCA